MKSIDGKDDKSMWIQVVQEWLNETYKGKQGYEEIPENGENTVETTYGLIRAVQIE